MNDAHKFSCRLFLSGLVFVCVACGQSSAPSKAEINEAIRRCEVAKREQLQQRHSSKRNFTCTGFSPEKCQEMERSWREDELQLEELEVGFCKNSITAICKESDQYCRLAVDEEHNKK
jgi:hypothetical protein